MIARPDKFEFSAFWVALALAEGLGAIGDIYLSDDPATAIFFGALGSLAAAVILCGLLIYAGVALFRRRWRRAASRLLGPPAALLTTALLVEIGLAPWRMQFEIMRPYYVYRVWRTSPSADGHKSISFVQMDKELWTGHESRVFVYADVWPGGLVDRYRTVAEGVCERSDYTELGAGFRARHAVVDYLSACPTGP